jgi:DNA replication factor GINS
MTLTVAEIDKISREIRDYYRQESATVQIQKIRGNFYEQVKEAMESLEEMAKDNISPDTIDLYRKIMDKKDMMEKNLRNFLLKRYEKILRDSLFEIGSTVLEKLTPEEKIFIMNMHNQMQDILEKIIKPSRVQEPVASLETVVQGEYENESTEKDQIRDEQARVGQSISEPMIPVVITADYLPVATSAGDFYLHRNDIVYLPEKAAEIITSRSFGRQAMI